MKILILTFYYTPDLSAGSFRNTALVTELEKQLSAGSSIDVVTTLPSRYASFSIDAPKYERIGTTTIHRIDLPLHKSGMIDQSLAFICFARKTIKLTKYENYDLVFASSSRLMTAALGSFIARRKKSLLYLDIRDIFVETIQDVITKKLMWILKPIFSYVEKWSFGYAHKINFVSEGFRPYFLERYPDGNFSCFTNGIDKEFALAYPKNVQLVQKVIPEVIYAGNLGEGQGLHLIIPYLAKHYEGRLKFKIFGDGGRKASLEEALRANNVKNVELMEPVKRDKLIEIYKNSDVLFLHLNDYDAFLKVLPSKLFEYAAVGKPIWAGVSGYAAEFLREHVTNVAIFPPCKYLDAINSFENLNLKTQSRNDFLSKFSRDTIMQQMSADIIQLANCRKL